MKTITILVFTIILNGCGSAKNATSSMNSDKEENAKTTQVAQDSNMVIEYSAMTRGSFNLITVNSKDITYQMSRTEKATNKACSKEDWSKVMQYAKAIDLKTLNTIEPPSKAHQYDGAAIASLKITKDGETYQTQSFDGGNPPKAIANLVNTVIELSNTGKTKGN